MKIAYAPLNICMDTQEDKITCLILEHPKLFCDIICDIYSQINGNPGTIVLSEKDHKFEMKKHALLITQMIPFEINQKPLLNALYARMKQTAMNDEMFLRTYETAGAIDLFISTLAEQCEGEIIWDRLDDLTALFKALSVRFYEEQQDLHDRLLDHMLLCREYLGKNVFITVNLRSYIGKKEAEELFHSIVLHKITLICIENREYPVICSENRLIVDEDFCVI